MFEIISTEKQRKQFSFLFPSGAFPTKQTLEFSEQCLATKNYVFLTKNMITNSKLRHIGGLQKLVVPVDMHRENKAFWATKRPNIHFDGHKSRHEVSWTNIYF